MTPRNQNYDPRGNGSMLRINDKLNITPVMFPFVNNDGDIMWSLGLSNKTQAELDAAATAAAAKPDAESKRKELNGIKTLAFSTLIVVGTIKDKNGELTDYIPVGTAVDAVKRIVVTPATTEATFAADWTAQTAGKSGVQVNGDIIAISKSNKPYRRASQFDLF